MATPHLLANELAASQSNKSLTVNSALTRLDGAIAGMYSNTNVAGASNAVALTEAQFLGNHIFKLSGAGAAFTLTTQGTNSGAQDTNRVFVVHNADSTYTCTVESDAAGTTVDLLAGETKILYQLVDDIIVIGEPAVAAPTIPYDIGFYFPGTPTTSQVLAETFVGEDVDFADDFAGSYCRIGTNPTSTFVIDVAVNGVNIGDISISTGGVATFTTDSGALAMTAGQRITFTAPVSVDATAADITVLLKGDVA